MKDLSEYKITEPMSALEIIKERIIPLIEEDSRRMRMGCWIDTMPECGTVGCIAGWTTYVTDIPHLGRSYSETAWLLVPPSLRSEFKNAFISGSHFHTPDGTPEQAEAVINFLNRFCEKHEKDLRCWIIDPTSSGLGSDKIDPYTGKVNEGGACDR